MKKQKEYKKAGFKSQKDFELAEIAMGCFGFFIIFIILLLVKVGIKWN